jgi:hypothetical protein
VGWSDCIDSITWATVFRRSMSAAVWTAASRSALSWASPLASSASSGSEIMSSVWSFSAKNAGPMAQLPVLFGLSCFSRK